MADIHIVRTDRRIEGNFKQGWGFAAFICILTAAFYIGAYVVHRESYHPFTDVRFHAKGSSHALPH